METRAFTMALVLSSTCWAAAPPVGPLTVERPDWRLDDMVISWEPPATPVDGYNVYVAVDPACTTSTLIYTGTAATYTVRGALGDPAPALYRVTSFVGTDESDPSPPVYKYGVDVRQGVPGGHGLNLLARPYHTGPAEALDWCYDMNHDWNDPLVNVQRYDPSTTLFRVQPCTFPFNVFELESGVATFAVVIVDVPADVVIQWGHTPERWTFPLPGVFDYDPDRDWGFGFHEYLVALPYDHGYPDLAAVAADIPSAVQVLLSEVDYLCDMQPCRPSGIGLSRASSSDPWSGTNVSLDGWRGHGLQIGVDTPTVWEPRRLCTGPISFRGRVATLRTRSRGDDIELTWNPTATPGARSYDIYRVANPEALTDLGGEPVLLSVGVAPTFPIVDVGAMRLPGPLYYAVIVR